MTFLMVLVVTLLPAGSGGGCQCEPIDARVRLAISQWPDDAPRGAVSTFCAEHGISRQSFYKLRARAQVDGPAAVLEPRSRRPRSSPSTLADEVRSQAVRVRAAIASDAPASLAELSKISGVGENKLAKYGEAILEMLGAESE